MIKSCHPHSLTTGRCDCYSHVTYKGAEARRRHRGLFIPGPASPVWAADCPHPLLSFSPRISACLSSSPSLSTPPTPLQRLTWLPCLQAGSCRSHRGEKVSADPRQPPWLLMAPGGGGGGGGEQGMHPPACGGPCNLAGRSAQAGGPPNLMSSVAGYHFRLPWSG